ncbi:TonB-dependent receptor domain-containing protein [Simiduia agarivorans]|uniref:Fe transport outer membrane receptor protein n=1 Tax=Simiduia agarivorans (strain DSM 21679 / JCM 13881 / BCRC 17597 / SA1) TaxID=1117647 RepID=K4KPJ4_SIMAS|nr:TonB-dependent receptor [Simiduia agarivorans]AFV00044.2 Fe transport outer membrane receptor protein [Simiduia agarivorans SA1 = DSM 21679]
MNTQGFAIGLMAAAIAGQVWGNTDPVAATATDGQDSMETVQVWATRVKSSSVYLGETQIVTRQADHLSELMRDIPGVDIGGTHSVNQRINIRGLDDRNLNITIDGARQNNYLFHHMGNLLVNPDILRSVDVDVGANSVLAGALGGAVRFETKSAADLLQGASFGARAQLGYNTNAASSGSLTAYGKLTDNTDLLGYINQIDRRNFKDGNGTEILGNDGRQMNGLVKFGVDLNPDHRLTLTYDRYDDRGDYTPRPDMGVATNSSISGDVLFDTEFGRQTLNLGYRGALGDAGELVINGYQARYTLWRDEENLYGTGEVEGRADNTGVVLLATQDLHWGLDHALTLGAEWNDYQTEYIEEGAALGAESQDARAIYLQDRLSLTDSVFLTPGVRYDQIRNDSVNGNETYGDWSFALAAEWHLTQGLQLLASSTEVFKAPELTEVLVGAGFGKPANPDLKAEQARNDQIGVQFSRDAILGADQFTAGFNLFRTHIDNAIQYSTRTGDSNVGKVDIDGGELSLVYAVGQFNALFTYARSRSDTHGQTASGTLEREVGDSVGLELAYTLAEWDLVWTSRLIEDEPSQDKPGYDIHNVSLRWQPAAIDGLYLVAGVDNIFNAQYTSHASRVGESNHPRFGHLVLNDYEPGRNVKLTASYSF